MSQRRRIPSQSNYSSLIGPMGPALSSADFAPLLDRKSAYDRSSSAVSQNDSSDDRETSLRLVGSSRFRRTGLRRK